VLSWALILAAGNRLFGIRGGILANWGADFGFTGAPTLATIGGAGFTWILRHSASSSAG
jgi:hypothetical protein